MRKSPFQRASFECSEERGREGDAERQRPPDEHEVDGVAKRDPEERVAREGGVVGERHEAQVRGVGQGVDVEVGEGEEKRSGDRNEEEQADDGEAGGEKEERRPCASPGERRRLPRRSSLLREHPAPLLQDPVHVGVEPRQRLRDALPSRARRAPGPRRASARSAPTRARGAWGSRARAARGTRGPCDPPRGRDRPTPPCGPAGLPRARRSGPGRAARERNSMSFQASSFERRGAEDGEARPARERRAGPVRLPRGRERRRHPEVLLRGRQAAPELPQVPGAGHPEREVPPRELLVDVADLRVADHRGQVFTEEVRVEARRRGERRPRGRRRGSRCRRGASSPPAGRGSSPAPTRWSAAGSDARPGPAGT